MHGHRGGFVVDGRECWRGAWWAQRGGRGIDAYEACSTMRRGL